MRNNKFLIMALLIGIVSFPRTVMAHDSGDVGGGLLNGLLHPVQGLDHLVAMIAVGLWGAQMKSPAIWVLPVAFPLVMALGGALGARGVPLPAVEMVIAVSAVVLGLMVAVAARPPFWGAAALVAVFAFYHGHAHGTELPTSASPFAYGVGFVVATGLLHVVGIAIGRLNDLPKGARVVRGCGAGIVCVGLYILCSTIPGLWA